MFRPNLHFLTLEGIQLESPSRSELLSVKFHPPLALTQIAQIFVAFETWPQESKQNANPKPL